MYHLVARLRTRITTRAVAATTFCEDCGAVCTPDCRREALRERPHGIAPRATLVRV